MMIMLCIFLNRQSSMRGIIEFIANHNALIRLYKPIEYPHHLNSRWRVYTYLNVTFNPPFSLICFLCKLSIPDNRNLPMFKVIKFVIFNITLITAYEYNNMIICSFVFFRVFNIVE